MLKFTQIAILALFAMPALADDHDEDHAAVDILPGWRADADTHIAALRVTLDDGWKTYWRAPGEAGLPPVFDWSQSKNVADVKVHWPVPEVFLSSGIETLGFHDELVLPLEIALVDPSAAVTLAGELQMGICDNICVPFQADVSAELSGSDVSIDPRIERALQRRPDTAQEAALMSARCALTPISDGVQVTAQLEFPVRGPDEIVVVEAADRSIWVSAATANRVGGVLTTVADLVPPTAAPFALDPTTLRFTVLAGGSGLEIHGCDWDN